MKYSIIVIFTALSIVSCKKSSEKVSDTKTNSSETCYQSVLGNDSVKISLSENNGQITGNLNFHNVEKGQSIATLTGTQSGDTLKIKSKTTLDNVNTYNDVYLLKKDGKLYEGVGEVQQINDSTLVFVDPTKIDYNKSFIFEKVDCK